MTLVLRSVALLPYREQNQWLQSRSPDIILPYFTFYGYHAYHWTGLLCTHGFEGNWIHGFFPFWILFCDLLLATLCAGIELILTWMWTDCKQIGKFLPFLIFHSICRILPYFQSHLFREWGHQCLGLSVKIRQWKTLKGKHHLKTGTTMTYLNHTV